MDINITQRLTDVISDVEFVRTKNMDQLSKILRKDLFQVQINKKKEQKAINKKYAQATKVKNANPILLQLLAATLQILPYVDDAQTGDSNKFIGKFLVYNDEHVATASSHALQKMITGSLKFDIINALTNHTYTRCKYVYYFYIFFNM